MGTPKMIARGSIARQQDADEDERDGGGDVYAFAEGAADAAEEAGGADQGRGRLERDLDGREARLVFEETSAALDALDLRAHVRQLALDRDGVRDLVRLLHDVEQLRFERALRAQARVEVDELLGHVLPRDLLGGDAAADGAYVV